MNNQLHSISKIFTEKLFRIPDYQRGYAWGAKQLKDYWSDILQLEDNCNHYVGVLTLEPVVKEKWELWEEDKWIIESKSYEPLYVVDGQQRLTTTIILLQVITETIKPNIKLNYTSVDKIKEKFIFDTKDNGISRSYIFGYEKDNPSYEFLKRSIFQEDNDGYRDEETIYTRNLEEAKRFFTEAIRELTTKELEVIYKKVTQHLLFNIYSISNDIDVFVTFETMNNRGKPLSNLELLKNRLIYLSTRFKSEETEKLILRKKINDTWKAIYHNLGKNKDRPINDDFFLITHFVISLGEELKSRNEEIYSKSYRYGGYEEIYADYLLDEKFNIKRIIGNNLESILTINEVLDYINSLQKSVKIIFNIFNPTDIKDFDDEEKLYLDKLYRLSPREYSTLTLAFYLKNPTKTLRLKFLKLLERYAFFTTIVWRGTLELDYETLAIELTSNPKETCATIIKKFEVAIEKFIADKQTLDMICNRFKSQGFYDWRKIRYFLFEYELSLKGKSKTKRDKIFWKEYAIEKEEYITVEHIYPQKPKDNEWKELFNFHHKQNEKLCNSLGNLLPLSKPKNSSLQNSPFKMKVDNEKNNIGYRYGSYSENEVSKLNSWTPDSVLERGIKLLDFMELRWGIKLGDRNKKIEILGLSFLIKKTK